MHAPDAAELVTRFLPLAFSLARQFSRCRPWLEADFRSDAAAALWRAATDFKPDTDVSAFAAFARRRIRWALIRTAKRRALPQDEALDAVPVTPTDPAAALDCAELLARLPPDRQQLVTRIVMHGESVTAVARERGVTASAVSQAVRRSLASLRTGKRRPGRV